MNYSFDAWSVAALLLIGGLAIWGFRMLKHRIEEQRYQEQLAELEFEASLLSGTDSAISADAHDAVFLQPSSPAPANAESNTFDPERDKVLPQSSTALADAPITITTTGPVAADVTAKSVIYKLEQAGILKAVEGYLELHGNPKGAAMLRFINGKLALLVPHMESEAFLRQNSRRADMIVMVGADGGAFIVRPLEEIIAENISVM